MTNRIRKTLNVKLVDLTAKAVDGWLMRMSENYRPATIQSSFVVLKLSCTDAVTHGILLSNPCDGVRAPKVGGSRVRPRSGEDAKKFMAAQSTSEDLVILRFLLETGALFQEMAGLMVKDLDLHAGTIIFRRALKRGMVFGPMKNEWSRRTLFLGQTILGELSVLCEGKKPDDLIFQSARGRPLYNELIHVRFKKAAHEAGVPDIRIHDLRHTHALRIDTPIVAVSKRLGHKNPTTTMNLHAHVLKDMEMNVARSVDELFAAVPRAEN